MVGVCRDLNGGGCSLKGIKQEVPDCDNRQCICRNCGTELIELKGPNYKKYLKILFSLVIIFIALFLLFGPDVIAPSKPVLLSDIPKETWKKSIQVKIKGEKKSYIFLNDKKLNTRIDNNGEATISLPVDCIVGKSKDYSIYLVDDANNSSDVLSFNIKKIPEPDKIPPKKPIIEDIPLVELKNRENINIEKNVSLSIKGEVGAKIFVNDKDINKTIPNKGSIKVNLFVTKNNIFKKFKIYLKDKAGNKSESTFFKFEVVDRIPPEKPVIVGSFPKTTTEKQINIKIGGEINASIYVNGDYMGEINKNGQKDLAIDLEKYGTHKFEIYLKDKAGNESEKLRLDIYKDIPQPKILSEIPKKYYCDKYLLKVGGERGLKVYINNQFKSTLNSNGVATIELNLLQSKDFNITLSNGDVISNPVQLSISKEESEGVKSFNGMNFVHIPKCKQKINYQIKNFISNQNNPIYTEEYIEPEKAFFIQTTPVTVEKFKQFISQTDYNFTGNLERYDSNEKIELNHPVVNVTIEDVKNYIKWLNDNNHSVKFRLPTVKEWIATINQNIRDNSSRYLYRPTIEGNENEVRYFFNHLYEFSSTECNNREQQRGIQLISNAYTTDIEYAGTKICEPKNGRSNYITFRLVVEQRSRRK